MAETIEIPVKHKNQELTFKASVIRFGYIHRIVVDLNGTNVIIERDEEGNYRALVEPETVTEKTLDKELIGKVIDVLQSL